MWSTKHAWPSLTDAGIYKQLSRRRRIWMRCWMIRRANPLKIVLGAGPTEFEGWIQTDKDLLDVTRPHDWSTLFKPASIDFLLSEHMLEHLTEQEGRIAVTESYKYLKPGGLFRIAVPDGYRRDWAYVAEVNPPRDGHKMLYNVDTLTSLLQSVGFSTTPLEYFDAQEQFHAVPWDEEAGLIQRSVRFDQQHAFQRGELFYTSVIVDARKD